MKALASDVDLQADPTQLQMEIVPGMTRSATVAITNPGSEAIVIMPSVVIPGALQGVAIKKRAGIDYSAVSWLSPATSQ